jgi:TorA maturation chaperone TorD
VRNDAGEFLFDDEDLEGLVGFYRLLSRLWVAEIDQEWLEALVEGSLSDVACDLELPVDEATSDEVERLAVDYCGLMIGPHGHVAPHQSVWAEGQFQGNTVISMKQFLDVVGEEVDSSMSDHLGVQLGVMGRIVEELAGSPDDAGKRDDLVELGQAFFVTHVAWIQQFLARAAESNGSDFYGRLIEITAEFLEQERTTWIVEPSS